jgi:hypothetical protein
MLISRSDLADDDSTQSKHRRGRRDIGAHFAPVAQVGEAVAGPAALQLLGLLPLLLLEAMLVPTP